MNRNLLIIFFLSIAIQHMNAQDFIVPLWESNIPNYQKSDEREVWDSTDIIRVRLVQEPNITVFLPAKKSATGQAVIICPGGGYHILAYDWEGFDFAKWLNSKGIAAIVLKYRLPGSKSNIVGYKSPLLDAQRAVRLTRYHAKTWNVDPAKIGIMGFSAGGHLASTAGTHFDAGNQAATDKVDQLSSRPDFMVLVYPVITFTQPFMHEGSKKALLGENPDQALVNNFSNELQVTANTPPTFLIHAADDKAVPVENSLAFFNALRKNNVVSEMHIYPQGGHGFGLAVGQEHLSTWSDRLGDWLKWINK